MATHIRAPETTTPSVPRPRRPAPIWFVLMLAGSTLGIVSGAWQTVERISYAAGTNAEAFCEINSVLSCNSVFAHWQSSAFGIPNSLISLPVFALLASAGLAGLLGTRLSRPYAATMFGATLFMAGFLTWYMQQSAFAIGVLCIYCLACAVAVVVTGIGLTRAVGGRRSASALPDDGSGCSSRPEPTS